MRNYRVGLFKKMLLVGMVVPLFMSFSLIAGETVRIMPLGDSITHENYRDDKYNLGGAEEIPEANRTAYRDDLLKLLQTDGYTVDFVGSLNAGGTLMSDADHEGHNGLTDAEMAANVYGYLTNNPADIVLLHIGTNGVITDNGALDVANTLKEIDRYETDNNTNVKVILSRIINCWKDWNNTAAGATDACTDTTVNEITTFNNNVIGMANTRIANGDDIVIVDMENGAGFVYDATDMIDDLHPNDTGYAKMANVWYEALVDNIPLHHWKLDEATEPYIDTYRDANGTCVTACPTQTSGIISNAQLFDGSTAEVNVVDDGTFDWAAGDSFTIEFWMKPDSTTNLQVAIGRHAGTSGNDSWWVGREGNKVKISIGDSLTSIADIDTSGNVWTHVVAVKDFASDQIRLYINGVEDNSVTGITLTDFSGTEPVNIGWFFNKYWFDGALDEMRVYNGVLSAEQIKQHYDNGNVPLKIISTPIISAEVNTPYTYDVNSNDPSATFAITLNPGWMNIDPNTGLITGTPSLVANDDVNVTADNVSQTVVQSFVVKVRDTASLPSGMQHYWKLDENDGATTYIDEYNGATDAMCSAGCPTQILGQVGDAQDFSILNSDLDVPDDDSFDWAVDQNFTVMLWMKPNNTNGIEVAIGRHAGSSGNGSWWIGRDGNKVIVSIGGAANIISNADIDITGTQWTHVVAVKDVANSVIRLYINGIEDNTTSITSSVNFVGTEPVNIGWFETKYWFDGALDDIAIFDGALSASEINAYHQNGYTADVTKPVITMNGSDVSIELGTAYTDEGATASDNIDGDITANIVTVNPVDINTVGVYTVT
ncbi:LamG-like jellyroll fold domain-containing protein, partial [Sulfurovum sp. TSL6]|uniref:LamG-like jellyroll fold domain-containing protein n=1 Tax=Sulfurovum sp. TSL6 TaxID=2826995 RepID=UPI001CC3E8F9